MSKAPRKKNDLVVGKESKDLEKSNNKLRKQTKKFQEEKEKARDDARVEISMDEVITLENPSSSGASAKKDQRKIGNSRSLRTTSDAAEELSDANSEIEEQEMALKRNGKGKGMKAFEQRDLVARAFAGDNVVQVRIVTLFLSLNRSHYPLGFRGCKTTGNG